MKIFILSISDFRLETEVSKNVHDLNARIKRHSDGTYTSDLSKSLDQDLAMEFLHRAIEGKLRYKATIFRYPLVIQSGHAHWQSKESSPEESQSSVTRIDYYYFLWLGDSWYLARLLQLVCVYVWSKHLSTAKYQCFISLSHEGEKRDRRAKRSRFFPGKKRKEHFWEKPE